MKKSIFLLLISSVLFIGCQKRGGYYIYNPDGTRKKENQCDRIIKKVEYIESQSIESSSRYSLDDENRLYQGLAHCRDREEKGSADYIEIQRLMGVVSGLIKETDELTKEFHEIHGQP